MAINTMKSKSMIMGSSRKIQYLESNFNIFHDDVLLDNVKYEKLHGITIDNCLSWCQQINHIVSKISSGLGLMCRLRTYLPVCQINYTNNQEQNYLYIFTLKHFYDILIYFE
jgi:hypothetical protein